MIKIFKKCIIFILILFPFLAFGQSSDSNFQNLLNLFGNNGGSLENLYTLDRSTSTLGLSDDDISLMKAVINDSSNGSLPLGIVEKIYLEMEPNYPNPGEETFLSIRSYGFDLSKSNITWYLNNYQSQSGVGLTDFNFKMAPIGQTSNVKVLVEKFDGGIIEKEYVFTSGEVDLIIEPQTNTYPLYQGKSWPTYQSEIKIIALPNIRINGVKQKNTDFKYDWLVDNETYPFKSGVGKNVFYYNNDLLAENPRIRVIISHIRSNYVIEKEISLELKNPLLLLYEDNPIYGIIFNKSLQNNLFLDREEIKISAHPIFFDKSTLENTISWIMNGSQIQTSDIPNKLTLRIEGEESGMANISAHISNSINILQSAQSSFDLSFDKKNIKNNNF